MKRGKPIVIVALALGVLAASLVGAQQPPTNLQQVGDHWTAWNPPTDFPAGAEVYTVERGDTLWDLSERFYGDPYLWPQLWERNQYIEDAHWIYPGDPLVVSVEVTPMEELGEMDLGGEGDGEEEGLRLSTERTAPQPLGTEDDIYCSGYIGEDDEEFGYSVIGSEYESLSPNLQGVGASGAAKGLYGSVESVKIDLSIGDIVYLDGGMGGGLSPGLVFTVVNKRWVVNHPLTGEEIGRLYTYQGRIRILSVQPDTAIGEIVQACMPIRVGDVMKPFVPQPVPLGRREGLRPVNHPVAAEVLEGAPVIVRAKDEQLSLGQDHVVYIDVGFDDGVTPGDMYTIYRDSTKGLPPIVLGELAVLTVNARSSVAKILESRYSIYLGDRLDPK